MKWDMEAEYDGEGWRVVSCEVGDGSIVYDGEGWTVVSSEVGDGSMYVDTSNTCVSYTPVLHV